MVNMNLSLQSMAIEMPPVAAHPNRAPFRGVLTFVDRPSEGSPSGAKGHRVLLTRGACEKALPSLLGMGLDYAPSLEAHDAQRKIGVITEANIVDGRRAFVDGNRVAQGFSPANSQPGEVPALAAEGRTSGAKAHLFSGAQSAGLKPCSTRIEVAGFLYARDFPKIVRTLRTTQPNFAGAEGSQRHLYGMSYEITEAVVRDFNAPVWIVTEFTFTGAAVLRRDKAAYRNTWFELI